MTSVRSITPTTARRLAIAAQRLNDHSDTMLDTIRALGCLQLDPTSVVAKSHLLVLWSRLGAFDLDELEALLWKERKLFEYWAHAASIVLTENYPLHLMQMRKYSATDATWAKKWREWAEQNEKLRDHVLNELTRRGPLQFKDMNADDLVAQAWKSSGWTDGYTVERMVDYLWVIGQVMVSHRKSAVRFWDLSERVLPDWTPREELADHEIVRRATQIALKALGVATAKHIPYHFMRNNYANLPKVLDELEAEKLIEPVQIVENDGPWQGKWYVHTENLPLLERIEKGDWQPRTTLLSPFDNLICDRARTEKLFNFKYAIEIYVPKHKRQYGYFVLPILHGDQLIGRIDPALNRKEKKFVISNVYPEPDAPADAGKAIAESVQALGKFIGAEHVEYGEGIAKVWKKALS
ncbi:MAG: crosslink repair DNA glycosylase YcaQ family protein [Anaerolineae bacterium]